MVSSPLFETAKTEHKAEMEIPATTKVKVTDFFQRLVCGLLIFFHSPCGYILAVVVLFIKWHQMALIHCQDVEDLTKFTSTKELFFATFE